MLTTFFSKCQQRLTHRTWGKPALMASPHCPLSEPQVLITPGSAPWLLQSVGALPTSSLSTGSDLQARVSFQAIPVFLTQVISCHKAMHSTAKFFPTNSRWKTWPRGGSGQPKSLRTPIPAPGLLMVPTGTMHRCVRNPSRAPVLACPL